MLTNRISVTAAVARSCLAAALTAACTARPDDKIVKIDSGTIEGAVSGEVLSFKGIPYAAPPVVALRWRAPQPVTSWSGVRPATKYGPDCMQKPVGGDVAPTAGEFSEVCLFVSVWRPVTRKAGAALPVLVWRADRRAGRGGRARLREEYGHHGHRPRRARGPAGAPGGEGQRGSQHGGAVDQTSHLCRWPDSRWENGDGYGVCPARRCGSARRPRCRC
jgi:Carboxylesterase family